MPRSVIACRLACYRPYEALAAAQLGELGVRCVEVRLPPAEWLANEPDWAAAEAERLAGYGLSVTTVHADLDLTRADTARQVSAVAPFLRQLRCSRLFVATPVLALPHDVQCERLRHAGEAAAEAGLVIALETHPDLAANADQARRTLSCIDHAAVRLNFDTANIYFYNRGLDCVAELRRVAPFVTSVHLKDTNGVLGERHFPALREGIVDFAGVFAQLDASGFEGPCTIEVEGIAGEERTAERILGRMASSVAHLRRLGRM